MLLHTGGKSHALICGKAFIQVPARTKLSALNALRSFVILAHWQIYCTFASAKNRYINQGIYDKEKTSAAVVE